MYEVTCAERVSFRIIGTSQIVIINDLMSEQKRNFHNQINSTLPSFHIIAKIAGDARVTQTCEQQFSTILASSSCGSHLSRNNHTLSNFFGGKIILPKRQKEMAKAPIAGKRGLHR